MNLHEYSTQELILLEEYLKASDSDDSLQEEIRNEILLRGSIRYVEEPRGE